MADMPRREGFYWARALRQPTYRHPGYEEAQTFAPVQVFENYDPEYPHDALRVSMVGFESTFSIEDFIWGEEIPPMKQES